MKPKPKPSWPCIVVSKAWPATRWSSAKGDSRLVSAQSFQTFPNKGAAARAIDRTVRYGEMKGWSTTPGWRRQDFDVRRVGPGRIEP